MMNLLLTPAAIKVEHSKYTLADNPAMQMKFPPSYNDHAKETFNDKTRKSLFKINLFIRRLKWFNIFADSNSAARTVASMRTPNDIKSVEINQKW
jgi:hypothetical protein